MLIFQHSEASEIEASPLGSTQKVGVLYVWSKYSLKDKLGFPPSYMALCQGRGINRVFLLVIFFHIEAHTLKCTNFSL